MITSRPKPRPTLVGRDHITGRQHLRAGYRVVLKRALGLDTVGCVMGELYLYFKHAARQRGLVEVSYIDGI